MGFPGPLDRFVGDLLRARGRVVFAGVEGLRYFLSREGGPFSCVVGEVWGNVWGDWRQWGEELGDEGLGVFFVTSGRDLCWGCVEGAFPFA